MAKFVKGGEPGPGRPEGSKNKNYLDAGLWLSLAWEDAQKQDAEERLPLVKWAVELIMSRLPPVAATPGDSVSNAAIALATLEKARLSVSGTRRLDSTGGNGDSGPQPNGS